MAPTEQGPIHKIKNNIAINFVFFLLFILLMQTLYDKRKKHITK